MVATFGVTRSAAVLAIALVASACGASRSHDRSTPMVDRNVVLGDELRRYGSASLFDALRAMRPRWFWTTTPTLSGGTAGPMVYLDGRPLGAPSALSMMTSATVVSVRFYSPSEAHGRFGPGHLQGVIEVTSGPVR